MDAFLFVLEVFHHEKYCVHYEAERFQHGKYRVQHEAESVQHGRYGAGERMRRFRVGGRVLKTPVWAVRVLKTPVWAVRVLKTPVWAVRVLKTPVWAVRVLKTPVWAVRVLKTPVWAAFGFVSFGHGTRSRRLPRRVFSTPGLPRLDALFRNRKTEIRDAANSKRPFRASCLGDEK